MKVLHLEGPAPYCTNSFLLLGQGGGAVAIDPAPAAQQFEEQLARHGARLAAILLTHGHFDHMYSLPQLVKAWGCPVYLDPADAKGTALMPADFATLGYTEGQPLRLAGLEFTPWHTPGHSQGSWLLYCQGLLFCGDTLFAGDIGRNDLEGGSPAMQRQSLAKIRTLPLPPDTQVLPGHGPFSTLGEELAHNPYLCTEEF